MEKQVFFEVKCPSCRKSLMDETKIINDKPAIKLATKYKEERGFLYLCSRYGCYDHQSDIKVPANAIVEVHCPHCDHLLSSTVECETCQAPMVTFAIKSGGRVSLCSRHGCNQHYVSFQDLETAIRKFHEEFGE